MRIASSPQHAPRSDSSGRSVALRVLLLGLTLLFASPFADAWLAAKADEPVFRAKRAQSDSDSETESDSSSSMSSSSDDEADEQGEAAEDRRQRRRDRMRREQGRSRRSEIQLEQSSTQQVGIEGRGGHIGFETFGRNESITPVEAMPFLMFDQHMLFADARVFMTNTQLFGGNFGLGYRYLIDDYDRVFGGSLWYDIDESSGAVFHQAGLSLETYGKWVDIRSNFYLPVSDDEKRFSRGIIGTYFSGKSILYNTREKTGEAVPGVDVEIGSLLPSDFAARHAIRIYGGYYYFPADIVEDISGFKARMQANITDYLYTQVEMTKDDYYGTNFTLGVALQFSGGRTRRSTPQGNETAKLRRFPERNYNIIVPKSFNDQYGLTAINPTTGQPYVVQHVNTTGVGAQNGTITDPYQSIAQAQGAGGDIIFVHSGSVLNVPIALQPNSRILGEGATHLFDIYGWGTRALPNATAGINRPMLNNAGPNAVTLNDGAEFSGFVLNAPNNVGIFAGGVNGATVRNVDILNAGGDAILLQASTGNFVFDNVNIVGSAGASFHVNGGDASVAWRGALNNTAGRSVVVENTTGGTIDLTGTSILDNGGTGILVQSSNSNVLFGPVNITTNSATGIDIQGGNGNVAFTGTTSVTNTNGIGVRVNGAGGIVSFDQLNASATNGAALLVNNSNAIGIANGNLTSVGGAAADINNTDMNIFLTSVSSDGAAVGLRILNSAGTFGVFGTNAVGTGGVIQNAGIGIDVQNSGTVGFQFLDLSANGIGAQANNVDHFQIANSRVLNSTGLGVDALNVRRLVVNNSFLLNNGGGAIRSQATAAGSYDVRIVGNTITDNLSAAAIAISNSGAANGSPLALLIQSNDITTGFGGADAVNVTWNGALAGIFTSNAIHGVGANSTGFDINATSATHLAQMAFAGNTLDFAGSGSTGLNIITAGASNIDVRTTLINLNAANGTGMNFDLARSANVVLDTNTITDNVSGGRGIYFTQVEGPSTFRIQNNWIRLLDPGAGFDQGIIFNAVDTTNGTITLLGDFNNVVQGATQSFTIPIGTSTGVIFVNGIAVP